jgi:DNA helicase II / ATP-dependent DNA helicase PcrA
MRDEKIQHQYKGFKLDENIHELTGPLLILAGPGTGKTYQLARRIQYLVNVGNVQSDNITVITFTDAAAKSMKERISDESKQDQFTPPDRQPKLITTMHSLGYRIIREKYPEKSYRLVSNDKLRDILVGDAAQILGFNREQSKETSKCRQFGKCDHLDADKCKICKKYESIMRVCNALDYDDQILLACEILRKDPVILNKYYSYCRHLLVDEYQDINAAQFELIKTLSAASQSGLFVVGDDDQSIYSWRGGSPEFIRRFRDDYGLDAKVRTLTKSFRCHRHVLEGAISVVKEYDKDRMPEKDDEFIYKRDEGEKIVVHNVGSDKKEAEAIRKVIQKVPSSKSVLVLYPTKGFSREIIRELKKARIGLTGPLTVSGEGLRLISTLSQWLSDTSDSLSLRECIQAFINSPFSTVPSEHVRKQEKKDEREKTLAEISKLWQGIIEGKSNNLYESLEAERNKSGILRNILEVFKEVLTIQSLNSDSVSFISEITGKFLPWKKPKDILDEVNSWIALSAQINRDGQSPGVQLMTLQAAKGLEADIVCVIGLEEGVLPRGEASNDQISEQSRLMFVSMTRAKEQLHLFHARNRSSDRMQRNIHRNEGKPDISPSRFIKSIPTDHKKAEYHP